MLTEKQQLSLLRMMVLIRRFEERIKVLYKEKKIAGAIHLYIGQEAIAAGVCAALRDDDYVFSTHRGHGHALAKTGMVHEIMAELMGRDTGMSRGHGGSMHLFHPAKGLMGGNGIVGGSIPLSLGGAFSAQYRETDQVSVGFFSDGAVNQGTFGESMNLAALWNLPVLFVCENNHYAATTPVSQGTYNFDIVARARSYGVQGVKVDGNDAAAVYESACSVVESIRKDNVPRLIEAETYRIEPHCGIIPDERTPGERDEWLTRDPVELYMKKLLESGLLESGDYEKIDSEVKVLLDNAVEFGLNSPWPDPSAEHNRSWAV